MAGCLCATLASVQASRVSCTTDCSAQPWRPKAACKPGSDRRRLLISTKPCAPARIAIKASYNFCTGVWVIVFWPIWTWSRTGPNRLSPCSRMPRAARVARGEKRYDRDGVVVLLMVMVLQCERWELSLWVRPLAHLCNWLPHTVTLIRTKFRYITTRVRTFRYALTGSSVRHILKAPTYACSICKSETPSEPPQCHQRHKKAVA